MDKRGVVRQRRIEDLLGLPRGTAFNRLKKLILFNLVQQTNQDICFKCGRNIENVDELSIEHKQPWESSNLVELFWDLNNIAFSHLKCNRPDTNGSKKLRKIGPEGTSWCSKCQQFLPLDNFHEAKGLRWNNKHFYCKPCRVLTDKRINRAKKESCQSGLMEQFAKLSQG